MPLMGVHMPNRTNLKDFIMDTMRAYPDREMTQRDLINWFTETTGREPDFVGYNIRDTLYRLEDKGEVERVKLPDDRHWYWRLKLV